MCTILQWQAEYLDLKKKLSEFVLQLLDQVRGTQELDILLNRDQEHGERPTESSAGRQGSPSTPLARVQLALNMKERHVSTLTWVTCCKTSNNSSISVYYKYLC